MTASSLAMLHKHVRFVAHGYRLPECECISTGPVTASIALVSTGPGTAELRTKMPFSGGAGQLLWRVLQTVLKLNRNDVYTTNVIKRGTGGEAASDGARITTSEFGLWTQVLRDELAQLPNLQYILILGNEALEALSDHTGITNWRGSWITVPLGGRNVDALITINPAFVLRCNNILAGEADGVVPLRAAQKIFGDDFVKFKQLTQGKLRPYAIAVDIARNADDALRHLNDLRGISAPVSCDIETVNNETACVGFGTSPHHAFCIPFVDAELKPLYSIGEEIRVRQCIDDTLKSSLRFVAQNGVFDSIWLWYKDKLRLTTWYDTLLAHHTLYPVMPHSLAFLTSRYTTHPYYKDDKTGWKHVGDADVFWNYNGKDCAITLAVQQATQYELEQAHMDEFFLNHVMRLQPHLVRMCVGGVKIDVDYKEAIRDRLEQELTGLLSDFHQRVQAATGVDGYKPNPKSPRDMAELLFRRLKLVGRGTSTDKLNRARMANHKLTSEPSRSVLTALNTYIKAHKFFSTYVETEIDPDGRMRCEYRQSGTQRAPGRLSSRHTPWETGTNLQNQPSAAHPMFICEPGYCFFYIDGEQAEARFVGWDAGIEKWIADFEYARLNPGSLDCHRSLAADMWDMPYDTVPVKDRNPDGSFTLRYVAKRCRHGLNYRMAAQRLAEVTGLPIGLAYDAFRRYHRLNPELVEWWRHLEQTTVRDRVLYNSFGRRWFLSEPVGEKTLESIVAFRPQSTIGDLLNRVIYMSEDDDDWPTDARVALNIHDAIIGIAPESKADVCLSILKKHAEEPIPFSTRFRPHIQRPPLIIPATAKRTKKGTKWHEVTDEQGHTRIEFYDDNTGYHRWASLEQG